MPPNQTTNDSGRSYKEIKEIEDSAPEILCCPITQELMTDPVWASDGKIYDSLSLQKILSGDNPVSPYTRQPLTEETKPATSKLNEIQSWSVNQGLSSTRVE